jgi:hypothetical protein
LPSALREGVGRAAAEGGRRGLTLEQAAAIEAYAADNRLPMLALAYAAAEPNMRSGKRPGSSTRSWPCGADRP